MLVFVGGLISLVSSVVTDFFRQQWERQKLDIQARQHLAQAIYTKQTEFFDKLHPTLGSLNSFIVAIEMHINHLQSVGGGEATAGAVRAPKAAVVMDFNELVEQYYVYLPHGLLEAARQLFSQCFELHMSPSKEGADECLDGLLEFQNVMREFAGIDKLSSDLGRAFGKGHSSSSTPGRAQ
jgi:hypothetical protein